MKILYVTDLHGRTEAYDKALERARKFGLRVIVNGGDLYPVGRDHFRVQREFIEGWFRRYLERLSEAGITYLATLGNMDLRGHDSLFREVMSDSGAGRSLLDESATLGGWTFIGSPMTTDAPFVLKDRCLRDTQVSKAPPCGRPPVVSDRDGIHVVADWEAEARALPTLGEHLERLPEPEDPARAVYVLHQPPHGLGLGLIGSGADVGSSAVRAFLQKKCPRLSLHGHIHESPSVSGVWRAGLGPTVCVQPGQLSGDSLVSVTIDLESLMMQRDQ